MVQMSCNQASPQFSVGYDMRMPARMELAKDLNEISGITYNTDNHTVLAVSDSKRKIVEIDAKEKKLKDVIEGFAGSNDYEDLVKMDSIVFVLVSNGTIMAVPMNATDSSRTQVYPFPSTDKNDFETLYYDSSVNGLIMLCKSCEADKGQKVRTAYRFDLATRKFDSASFYTISTKSVKDVLKDSDVEFKPSAAAIHPIEKQLYILSSAGQVMAITDTRGTVKWAFRLNPDRNQQAEGIAFAPNGAMYISNEGKFGKPTLQIFTYHEKPGHKKTK
jgi:uncharacterized protein YjiK